MHQCSWRAGARQCASTAFTLIVHHALVVLVVGRVARRWRWAPPQVPDAPVPPTTKPQPDTEVSEKLTGLCPVLQCEQSWHVIWALVLLAKKEVGTLRVGMTLSVTLCSTRLRTHACGDVQVRVLATELRTDPVVMLPVVRCSLVCLPVPRSARGRCPGDPPPPSKPHLATPHCPCWCFPGRVGVPPPAETQKVCFC